MKINLIKFNQTDCPLPVYVNVGVIESVKMCDEATSLIKVEGDDIEVKQDIETIINVIAKTVGEDRFIKLNEVGTELATYVNIDKITTVNVSEDSNTLVRTSTDEVEVIEPIDEIINAITEEIDHFSKITKNRGEIHSDETINHIINIVELYNLPSLFRYGTFKKMMDYVALVVEYSKGEEGNLIDLIVDNGSVTVTIKKGNAEFHQPIESLPKDSIKKLLKDLKYFLSWDYIYNWIDCIVADDTVINMWNEMVSKEKPKAQILRNNAENIKQFGCSADELINSMVSGCYKNDLKYISMVADRLLSFETEILYEFVDIHELCGWLMENPDKAKQYMPTDIYHKAFEE